MKAVGTHSQDYSEALNLIEKSKEKGLTIFIVDKDLFYLKLLTNILWEDPMFDVHTFLPDEEYLNCANVIPDLVILENPLEDKKSSDNQANITVQEMADKLPQTEIVLISEKDKLAFIEGLHSYDECKLFFKEKYLIKTLKCDDQPITINL